MKKKELLKLPKIPSTKSMLEVAINDKEVSDGWGNKSYKYQTYYRAKAYGEILKVCIYERADVFAKVPRHEIYINKAKEKYLTFDNYTEKWKTAKINNLHLTGYKEQRRYYDSGTEKIITKYLQNGYERGYEAIYQFQEGIKANELRTKHRKITDKIDSVMELVPKLPKGFDEWIDVNAMEHSRYIYYEYSRNVIEGYCTYCKSIVPVKNPRHNKEGKCSRCKSDIEFKAAGRVGTIIDDGQVSIVQRTREGYIYRFFTIKRMLRNQEDIQTTKLETYRYIYNKEFDLIGKYEWEEFKSTGKYRWCEEESRGGWYARNHHCASALYTRNIKRVLKDSPLRYSALELLLKQQKEIKFDNFCKGYKEAPQIEYLIKLGLYKLTMELVRGRYSGKIIRRGKNINETLRINRQQLNQLIEIKGGILELEILQHAYIANVRLKNDQIEFLKSTSRSIRLMKFMRFTTPYKMIKYMKKEDKKQNFFMSDYYDYLEGCNEAGYDMRNEFILYPKNFRNAHDNLKIEVEEGKDQERDIELKEIAKELSWYEMRDENLAIIIPKTCKEIRNEGHTLKHCVARYIDRVVNRETNLLFLRKVSELDKPYYTIEIADEEVVQVRGSCNDDPTAEIEIFIEKFKKAKLNNERMKEAV